jgi:hypothetical protein
MISNNNLSAFEYHYIEDELHKNETLQFKIYFDSSDVITLLQGTWHFNKDHKFNWEKFKSQKNIEIHGIAGRGWLGEINLLNSHQDELIFNLANNDNDFPKRISFTKDDISNELLYKLMRDTPKENFENPNNDNFKRYVHGLKTNSKLLFKSNFVLYPYFWYDRYKKYFKKDKIIKLSTARIERSDLTKVDIFEKALTKLERIRKGKGLPNQMDALALAQLQTEVKNSIESNYTLPLPLFFTGSKYLRIVLKELVREDPSFLSYPHPDKGGKYIPVFREEDFFIIYPIFNFDKADQLLINVVEDIQSIKDSLTNLIAENYLDSEAAQLEQKIKQLLGENIDLDFFNKIWLKGGYKEFIESILNYIDYYENYDSKIESIVEFEKNNLKSEFRKELENTSLLKNVIWAFRNIQEETDDIMKGFHLPDYPSNDFGLIRFSFCSDVKELLDDIIESLFENLDANDNEQLQNFHTTVTELIDLIVIGSTKHNKQHELLTGLAVLWIYSKYDLIVEICCLYSKYYLESIMNNESNFNSFYAIYMAALAHSDNLKIGDFDDVFNKYSENIGIENYKHKLTKSFGLFQLWYGLTLKPVIPEHPNIDQKKLIRLYRSKLKDSIQLLLDAINILRGMNFQEDIYLKKVYYYLINNYLYYNIKGSWKNGISSKTFEAYLNELIDAEFLTAVWQKRFCDTLGWYYYRLAYINYLNKEFELSKEYLDLAIKYNEDSFKGPTPKRELYNYKQLENSIRKFKIDLKAKFKAHNILYK